MDDDTFSKGGDVVDNNDKPMVPSNGSFEGLLDDVVDRVVQILPETFRWNTNRISYFC